MPVTSVGATLPAATINANFDSLLADLARVARSNDNWDGGKGVVSQIRWLGGRFDWDGVGETDAGSDADRMHTFTFTVPQACKLASMWVQGWGSGDNGAAITVTLSGATIGVIGDGESSGSVTITATRAGAGFDEWSTYQRFGQNDSSTSSFGATPAKDSGLADWVLLPGVFYTLTSTRASADNVTIDAYPIVTLAFAQELTRR
jgi:hypothetical protein